jgi:DNA-binding transcriptional LysR family regulator
MLFKPALLPYSMKWKRANRPSENRRPRLAFNAISLILNTALAGLGLAYLPEDFVRDHVAAGRLVRVLADWSPVMTGYHLYYPNRQPSPAFALLLSALRHHF